MPKKGEKPQGALNGGGGGAATQCCPNLSLQPRLKMNILSAGSFPGAVNLLSSSYRHFCHCPLARGGLRVRSPPCPSSSADRVRQGWAGSGPVGWGPAVGELCAVAFPNLLHHRVSFPKSLFLICYAEAVNI